jgi:hypothetical protein
MEQNKIRPVLCLSAAVKCVAVDGSRASTAPKIQAGGAAGVHWSQIVLYSTCFQTCVTLLHPRSGSLIATA